MIHTNYEFYEEIYGGNSVPLEAFPRLIRRAETLLQSLVRQPEALEKETERVQHLLCEICELLYRKEGRGGLLRESLDGYDVTYESAGDNRELLHLIRQYLGNDNALYRGRLSCK